MVVMKVASVLLAVLGLSLPIAAQKPAPPAPVFPAAQWQRTTPAAAGWDLAATQRAVDFVRQIGATSFLFIQHGLIVAQGGDVAARTELHSCRKSFLSALAGIAVAQGQLHLDDTLASLHIDDHPPALSPAEQQATVRDLLQARSGVYHGAAYETKSMAAARPARGSHPPGTFWYYNNWDFNALGGIYERATGRSIYDALATQIATPIGMQDYRPQDGTYVRDPVSQFPAYTIRMSARDLARFALLYLHHGNWNGTQVVPAQWVADSVHPWSNTPSGGYGYLWWTADSATPNNHPKAVFPPGSFWLEGHLGQYAVAVPSLDMVVVVRIDSDITKKTIAKPQVAELMKLVAAAAGSIE
jgi:CubicO group peptidase (beta-lactamase class C family)